MGVPNNRKVILIDNYDSFTWNLYEYLCREGAEVQVFRNDKITLDEVVALKPEIMFISPGPGHPKTDSGISRDCIRHFTGKIPVVGVCMGQQCMFEVFGGDVAYAGEIVHGKTSQITHDSRGIFKNVPQGVAVTRYHSLAGQESTLPDVLEVSARTESDVIMGVRHKTYVVEGVQFHPESILSEAGRTMIKNILNLRGGTWEENERLSGLKHPRGSSILDKIYAQRQEDVDKQSSTPGFTQRDLQSNFDLGLAPPVQNFYERLQLSPNSVVIAEIKRASPSKGDIDINAIAAEQCLRYARAGASAISVLTEPHWFKGSIQDLINVRKALDNEFKHNPQDRPCVLRKEFIFSKYQILEGRLAGADTVLLIVKMLPQPLLRELYEYARTEVGIVPLVEVSSKEEMHRAIELDAKVIGVNNRDLHSFSVDLNTTSSLVSAVPADTILLALSGITNGTDAKKYKSEGVRGFLVGEALMRATDINSVMGELVI
ncbi:LANO_0E16578g1_1 [Lachancea nothofagi CBS 11611]|uniref:Multifunctional tryptophan biosynthesis protein n=1 Tax=Lachancea nothofagi CBS 11611 TaxID=1266666 RepID=A0A1G4K231_9SACH|nr:LANO_0E16578g1_1 [Lachancea nothofagi CBS 11611]